MQFQFLDVCDLAFGARFVCRRQFHLALVLKGDALLGVIFCVDHEVLHSCHAADLDAQLVRSRHGIERQADHRIPLIVIGGNQHRLIPQPGLRHNGIARNAAERNHRNAAGYAGRLREACICMQRKCQNEQAEAKEGSARDGSKRMHGYFENLRAFHNINWAPFPVEVRPRQSLNSHSMSAAQSFGIRMRLIISEPETANNNTSG